MARRTHFAAERLSLAGQAVLQRGLLEKWTFTKIQKELLAGTGEKISNGALGRYAARWREQSEQTWARQEQAKAFLAAVKGGDLPAEEMATALVAQALFENSDALRSADPISLSREERERRKLDLKGQELALRREEVEFNVRKFEALQARQERIKKLAEGGAEIVEKVAGSGVLTAEQVEWFKGLYGLAAAQ